MRNLTIALILFLVPGCGEANVTTNEQDFSETDAQEITAPAGDNVEVEDNVVEDSSLHEDF